MILDCLVDACLDSLKLFPFLLATYLFMEWLEHVASKKFIERIAKADSFGPAIGALLGVIPQCGFSGAAATLYAARVISLGTLISIFLSTSDEMLPIMISSGAEPALIGKVLAIKVCYGMLIGFILNFVLTKTKRMHSGFAPRHSHSGHEGNDIRNMCEAEGCLCDSQCNHEKGIHSWKRITLSALKHALQITLFVFIITFAINIFIELAHDHEYINHILSLPALTFVSSLLGLIPNCAISVGITELYLNNIISGGALIAGLLSNAGIGLLVLIRTNSNARENLRIIVFLVTVSFLCGLLVDAFNIL